MSNYEALMTPHLVGFESDAGLCHICFPLSSRNVMSVASDRPSDMMLAFFYCHFSVNHHF